MVSYISLWEIAIKNRIGKLPLSVNLNDIHKTLAGYGCGFVGIEQDIIAVFNTLPLLHRDPFDGILIATALNKNLTIITNDVNINKYNVPCVW
jgi:PIN domain nuclease of toxin-antitoxin system